MNLIASKYENKRQWILVIPIVLLIPVLLMQDYLIFMIIALLYLFVAITLGRKFVLFMVIVSYLTLVGDVIADYRLYVHLVNISLLIYFFLQEYGLKFSDYPSVPTPIIIFVVLLLCVMSISSIFSDYLITGLTRIIRSSYFLLIVYLFFSLIKSEEEIWFYIKTILFTGVVMAFSTFYELSKIQFDFLTFQVDKQFRSSGFISNVNAMAGFFAVSIPLAISLLFIERFSAYKKLILGLIVIYFLGLTITVSRSGFLSVFISLAIILYILKRGYFKNMLVSVLGLVIILFTLPGFTETFFELTRIKAGLSMRDHYWNMSLDMISNNFLIGVGPGSWGNFMFDYLPVSLESVEGQLILYGYTITQGANAAHNMYLVFFSEMGIFGLIIFFIFIYTIYYMTVKIVKEKKSIVQSKFVLIVGISAVATGMFVRGFFDSVNLFTFGWISIDLPFWFLIIILSYYYKNEVKGVKEKNKQVI